MSVPVGQWVEISKFDPEKLEDALKAGIAAYTKQYGEPPANVKIHPSLHTNGVFSTLLADRGLTVSGDTPYESWLAVGRAIKGEPMTEIKSSNISEIDYDPAEGGHLYVRFHKHSCDESCDESCDGDCGSVYVYHDVPPETYEQFLAAESKGKFHHDHIRDEFDYEKIEG